jgi:hypothetical protein
MCQHGRPALTRHKSQHVTAGVVRVSARWCLTHADDVHAVLPTRALPSVARRSRDKPALQDREGCAVAAMLDRQTFALSAPHK